MLKVDPSVGVTEAMVEGLAASYGESGHRAPVVLGHPKDNSPAWGWVTACEASEGNLYCDLEVTPEFTTLLSEGRFRERSVAFYDTNPPVLRHLGFLGATPPRIKGLEPINLSEYGEGAEVHTFTQLITKTNDMQEYLKPVVMFALSEQFTGLTPNSFKVDPVLEGDSISGVVNLSDGSEYAYKLLKDTQGGWSVDTKLANPEVIELSERVVALERQLEDTTNMEVVNRLYADFKLTEAILPKCDCLKLLSESKSGVAVKLLNNLPPLVSQVEVTEAVSKTPTSNFGGFEFAESEVYSKVVEKCASMGLNPANPSEFMTAYRSI